MTDIFTIIKKELRRIFTDKRMLMTLILPGVLIFVLYSLMGSFMESAFTPSTQHEYSVAIFGQPDEFKELDTVEDYKITINSTFDNPDDAKKALSENDIDLIVVYEDGFMEKLSVGEKPNVYIYYNSTSPESTEIYAYYFSALSSTSVQTIFYVNQPTEEGGEFDLATKEDTSAQIITMIVPFLLLMLLFSGCTAVSTESIAGEKERGTIATLLVTPVKRSHIALGKVTALAIASLVSSFSTFFGLILSMPKLLGEMGGITISMYSFGSYVEILLLIIVIVLFFTVVLSIISTIAKSVKEASQYSLPVMIFVMMFAITSMLGSGSSSNVILYFIPILNIVQSFSAIFSLSFSVLNFAVTILSNIVYIALGILLLTRMFNSEKIMFKK